MHAAKLHERVVFDMPISTPDGSGGTESSWSDEGSGSVICWANFRYLRGGETVQAARLSGIQPVIVTIRTSTQARLITAAWRMRDLRTSKIYNVRTDPVLTDDRAMLEILCESGVAV